MIYQPVSRKKPLFLLALLTASFVCSSGKAGSQNAATQPDISSSGRGFLEICSGVSTDQKEDPVRIQNDAACLGWVEGFKDGFTVRDDLLSVPQKDRMVCIPGGTTNIQIIHVIDKYLAQNPDKAHRATRLIASLALAGKFGCKAKEIVH